VSGSGTQASESTWGLDPLRRADRMRGKTWKPPCSGSSVAWMGSIGVTEGQ